MGGGAYHSKGFSPCFRWNFSQYSLVWNAVPILCQIDFRTRTSVESQPSRDGVVTQFALLNGGDEGSKQCSVISKKSRRVNTTLMCGSGEITCTKECPNDPASDACV